MTQRLSRGEILRPAFIREEGTRGYKAISSQHMKARVLCYPPKVLSTCKKDDQTDERGSNGEGHECQDRSNKPLLSSPVIEEEHHGKL